MAQSVVTFVDWLDQNNVNVFDADKAVTTEYGLLNNLFWDPTTQAYNHSTTDFNKYILDQLVGAIIGFQIHRSYEGTFASSEGSLQTQANNSATEIMQRLTNTSIYLPPSQQIWDPLYNTFKFEMASHFLSTNNTYKDLATNAYGIWALVEWFLESGSPVYDQFMINMAQSIYLELNQYLWNSTYHLYMDGGAQNFVSGLNYIFHLKTMQ